jgi:hypothetical protein
MEGQEGPEGPPGVIDTFHVNVENDQGMSGASISANFIPTPVPATLTVNVDAGTYLLTWYSEVMRVGSAGGTNFFVRFRDTTTSSSLALLRRGPGVNTGAPSAIPGDPDFAAAGDLFPFGGSMLVTLPAGPHTYRLEYAMSTTPAAATVLRAQHQRISLLRVQ